MNKTCLYSLLSALIISNSLAGCAPIAAMSTTIGVGRSAAQERRVGEIMDDVVIANKIRSRFMKENFKDIFTHVTVNSTEGRVLLTGSVKSTEQSTQATEIAWQVPGVQVVNNEITVEDISIGTMAQDSWIATTIRTKLLVEKTIKSVNYTIDVNNNTVFIAGIAQNNEELDTVEAIASKVRGVKKVISHVVLKDDPRRR